MRPRGLGGVPRQAEYAPLLAGDGEANQSAASLRELRVNVMEAVSPEQVS